MVERISRFLRSEDGNAVEYALIAALMAIALVAVLPTLRTGLQTAFTNISTSLTRTN
jgi:pilus assembly protein Flp/PilA